MSEDSYQRLVMELDLRTQTFGAGELPDGYRWVAWDPVLADRHAFVKWGAFREDLDGRVFSCLSQIDGCRKLMREISTHATFCPRATWMLIHQPSREWPAVDVGTIQGLERTDRCGAIQNIGVIPGHRRLGLGRNLLLQALDGFQQMGLQRARLEVTALNTGAVQLYESLGFTVVDRFLRTSPNGKRIAGSGAGFLSRMLQTPRSPSCKARTPQSPGNADD